MVSEEKYFKRGVIIMKKKSRIFSIMMVLVMLFCATPLTVSARNATFVVNDLQYLILTNNTVALSGYVGAPVNVTVPQTVQNGNTTYTVTQVWGWAFNDCRTISSITLPQTITSIGDYAFNYSTLKDINWANLVNLTSIGNYAFSKTRLTSVSLAGLTKLTKMGEDAFSYCYNLVSLTLPPNITRIEKFTFVSCYLLKSVIIPSKVTTIESNAFGSCWFIEQLFIPPSVTYINNAFGDCNFLSVVYVTRGSYAEQYFNKYFPGTVVPL